MGLAIDVESGVASGKSFALASRVCRIGSHPGMTIRIDDLPSHAVTVLVEDDFLLIINRSCRSLNLNRRRCELGQQRPWRVGDVATINGDVNLRLRDVPEHGAGAVEVSLGIEETADAVPNPDATHGNRGRKVVVAVVAVASLLLGSSRVFDGRVNGQHRRVEYLEACFAELRATPLDDLRLRQVERLLRRACIAELWQDRAQREQAHAMYQELRELLTTPRTSHDKYARDGWANGMEERILQYVEARLKSW
jgi:hypothetical protein